MRAVEVDWGFNWLWPSGVPPANRVSLSRAGQPYVSLNQYGHYITPTALSSACVLIWLLTPLQTLRVQACMFGDVYLSRLAGGRLKGWAADSCVGTEIE